MANLGNVELAVPRAERQIIRSNVEYYSPEEY